VLEIYFTKLCISRMYEGATMAPLPTGVVDVSREYIKIFLKKVSPTFFHPMNIQKNIDFIPRISYNKIAKCPVSDFMNIEAVYENENSANHQICGGCPDRSGTCLPFSDPCGN
ncbi:MAG: hypothetical protein J6C42_10850, partial [Clostridia bacterium]|nr:hypothetical protein [Clostridia bacterium]